MSKLGGYLRRFGDRRSFEAGLRLGKLKDAKRAGVPIKDGQPVYGSSRRQAFFFKQGMAASSITFTNGGSVEDLFELAESRYENLRVDEAGNFDEADVIDAEPAEEVVDEADLDEAEDDEAEDDEAEDDDVEDEADAEE